MSKEFAELLVRENFITQEQFSLSKERSDSSGSPQIIDLIQSGAIDEQKVIGYFSRRYSLSYVDLKKYQIKPELRNLIPFKVALKYRVIPLQQNKNTLVVATYDPTALAVLDDLKFRLKMNVQSVFTSPSAFFDAIDKNYGGEHSGALEEAMSESKNDAPSQPEGTSTTIDISGLKDDFDTPIVKFVNGVLADAMKRGASDIHFEPYENFFRLRFRIDGKLKEITQIPLKMRGQIISRLKIMADLDIAEKRLPQDGRIKIKAGAKDVDLRVSTMPVVFGEKVVMRILDKSKLALDMGKLGFEPDQLKTFQKGVSAPFGMVLVTGPTGSGKSTTLYSALAELNKSTDNISTVEDPVEYNLDGINQCQVNPEINLSFASALRTFLRQDPDIILVGEIRDTETVETAIHAALTGHLLLSTLHTNDAPSTIARLLNMDVQPVMIASALNTIVAQRLIRRLCKNCKKQVETPVEQLVSVGLKKESAEQMKVFHGEGCDECDNTGYKGRMAIHEVLETSAGIKELILRNANTYELRAKALEEGMKTLRMAALMKVARGDTSLEEALSSTAEDN